MCALFIIYILTKMTREELIYYLNQSDILVWVLYFLNAKRKCKKIEDAEWLFKNGKNVFISEL